MLFVERANEFYYSFCLSSYGVEAQRKRVLKARNLENNKDPKPDELTMSRMNPFERKGEVRTSEACNPLG